MTILLIILSIILVGVIYSFLTKRFVNPYKLIFCFGKKGSGKSTILAKLTRQYCKSGWTVYSTEVSSPTFYDHKWNVCDLPLDETKGLYEVHPIDPRKLYEMKFPEKSCLFIDEVSLIWDNRDFKTMDKNIIEWFRYQRHHKCRVYFFSQTFDIDKKLRDLADDMFLVNKYLRCLVIAKHIIRKPVVVHPSPEAPARIDDDMLVDSPLLAFFGGRVFAWIPYWARKFDSYK